MKIIKTKFKDLKIIKHNNFADKRGFLKFTYNKKIINWDNFIFDYIAYSKKNVFRGFHFQYKNQQAKLISVIKGKVLDCVVDLRKNSKTFGMYISTIISEKNSKSIFIPPGFAHGFCSLANENYVVYSCTKYREKKYEIGIQYNDKDLNIRWPIKNAIISKKDKNNLSFEEFRKI